MFNYTMLTNNRLPYSNKLSSRVVKKGYKYNIVY